MHKVIHIIFFFIGISILNGQNQRIYDSITYSLFLKNDMKGVIKNGEKSLDEGIDFFYLRLRLGIAYYNTANYEESLKHLKKAHTMYPTDTTTCKYLYYAYINNMEPEQAAYLAKDLGVNFQKEVNHRKKLFEYLTLNFWTGFNNNPSKAASSLENFSVGNNSLQGNTYAFGLSFKNRITNGLSLYTQLQVFNNKSDFILKTPVRTHQFSSSNWNTQLNLGFNYTFRKGWYTGLTLGYYHEQTSEFSISPPTSGPPRPNELKTNLNSFSGTVFAGKRFRYTDLSVFFSLGNLGGSRQLQAGTTLSWYPLGNDKFWGVTSIAFNKDSASLPMLINQRIGFKITPWLTSELSGSWGNHINYIGQFGFQTFNTVDPINFTAGADLNFKIKQFTLTPAYRLQQRTNYSLKNNENKNITNSYFNHIISISLKWNF